MFSYYSFDKVDSYNCVFNFIVGNRGSGKTFGAKKKAIKKALSKGEQFMYVRRYKDELSIAKGTFFADIEKEFPMWDFKIGSFDKLAVALSAPISSREEKKRVWNVIGFFVALSTAQSIKSASFPDVTTIIFDEFIIEKSATRYLPNEHIIFTNLYSTVDRNKDKTRVYFLANSVSIMNPYFIAYEIQPDENNEFVIKFDGFVICHFPQNKEFQNEVYQTKFGKFIQGTEYADYAIGNQFVDNHNAMLGEKLSKARYFFTLETSKGTFSVWNIYANDEYFIQQKRPGNENLCTLLSEKMDHNKTLLTFSDRPLSTLRTAFRSGRITFDNPVTRNAFTEIFKR